MMSGADMENMDWQAIRRSRAATLLRRARLFEAVRHHDLARGPRQCALRLLEQAAGGTDDPSRRADLDQYRLLWERADVLDREGYFDLADRLRAEADNLLKPLL